MLLHISKDLLLSVINNKTKILFLYHSLLYFSKKYALPVFFCVCVCFVCLIAHVYYTIVPFGLLSKHVNK
jgi:hypothetical protein